MMTRCNRPQSLPTFEPLEPRELLAATYPTGYEQYMLELLNWARANPAAEAAGIGISLNEGLSPGTISTAPKQPLAFNPYLIDAARGQSQYLIDSDTFDHAGQGGSNPLQRMTNAGYVFTLPWAYAENLGWYGESPATPQMTLATARLHVNLFRDATIAGRGHRVNMMEPDYREVGIGLVAGAWQQWNAVIATQDFALSGDDTFLTGVVFNDQLVTHDQFYTPGEGLGGITITATRPADGVTYTTTTWDSGGYTLAVAAGTYNVTASGGAMTKAYTYTDVVVSNQNVKRDFTPQMALQPDLAGSFDTAALPSFVTPGQKVGLPLVLANQGDGNAIGTITVKFYASADTARDDTDVLLGTSNVRVSLAPQTSATGQVNVTIPQTGLAPGQYYILAEIDTAGAIAESIETNNLAVSAVQVGVVWRFGNVGGSKGVVLKVPDASGNLVSFALKGAGYGEITGGSNFTKIDFYDTDTRSAATITPPKGKATSVGQIVVHGPILRLAASTTNLAGLDVEGSAGTIAVGHILGPVTLHAVTSLTAASPLVRGMQGATPVSLLAFEGPGAISAITFDSLAQWPVTAGDVPLPGGTAALPDVLATLALASLKRHAAASGLGTWTGDPAKLRPGLIMSFDTTTDPLYTSMQRVAFIYDNALAIQALLAGSGPDAESQARAFQIADALVLLQNYDPINLGRPADPTFTDLTPAPLRDAYTYGTVAKSRIATGVKVGSTAFNDTSTGNQAYVAAALLRAAEVATASGDAARAADYMRTAQELLLYVGRNRARPDPYQGFNLSENATSGAARSTENNIDLALVFDRMAAVETDAGLQTQWQNWRDAADHFRNDMHGSNARFATLDWISDDWQYSRAGTGLADDINVDLVSIDTGAWSALARGDDRDAAFDLLEFLATSTDSNNLIYTGFDPGFRAVSDLGQASLRDGVGSEATAYMALVARKLGDTAVLAALPDRSTLTAQEQANFDVITTQANAGATDHDLADFLIGQLGEIQTHAPNTDGYGLVASPVQNVGTGEYSLINGWSLASTAWGRFAYMGWNVFTSSTV